MAYLFKLSSRLIVGPVLPATNIAGTLQQFQTEIASLAFGRTHWARNFVFFLPLDCCRCFPGLYIKAKIGFGFLLLLFSFTSLLTPHRTLVNTHQINKCAKLVVFCWVFLEKMMKILFPIEFQ